MRWTRFLWVALLLALIPPLISYGQDPAGYLLGQVNGLRQSLGLPGYTSNGALAAAAQNQAQWMADSGQVSHTQYDGSTPSVRAQRAGYGSSLVSENIYMGTNATAATAWQWWINSAVHYRGLTSTNYTEIGVGVATGANGTAFVLVFGNPGGVLPAPVRVSSGSAAASSASGPRGLPPYVVGMDNYGNIMHEVQPGHTLGEIAMFYGYSWDDLERIRQLNEMSEPEGRQLAIGSVLLIPPWDGTYTPTPGEPPTVTPTPGAEQATEAAGDGSGNPEAFVELRISPTPTPPVGTLDVVPEWVILTADAALEAALEAAGDDGQPPAQAVAANSPPLITLPPPNTGESNGQSWTAATVTPTPMPDGVAIAAANPADTGAEVAAAPPVREVIVVQSDGPSPWLIAAVILQVAILGIAGVEFLRRSRRR